MPRPVENFLANGCNLVGALSLKICAISRHGGRRIIGSSSDEVRSVREGFRDKLRDIVAFVEVTGPVPTTYGEISSHQFDLAESVQRYKSVSRHLMACDAVFNLGELTAWHRVSDSVTGSTAVEIPRICILVAQLMSLNFRLRFRDRNLKTWVILESCLATGTLLATSYLLIGSG